ncbi:hypothetical protein BCO37747_06655 [Burkholderia contaminans]|jgi:hypothetical protein|uniref:Uncharacterized protein n=2 Tax=Burkholderia cepacia complex TaxID=87882 RepID=A0A250LMI9_9BURK|nr:hypothetical protein BCCH1_77500 [Burkholderia contaminans]CAB3970511.1 hypothetical protein BLA3211_05983 [Burkholderia aenigmatica]VWD55884.1 hypothetical protein BCO37747_06655 [Burkholderia contaminans]
MHSAGRDRGLLRRSRHFSKVRDPVSRDCRIVGRDRSASLVPLHRVAYYRFAMANVVAFMQM